MDYYHFHLSGAGFVCCNTNAILNRASLAKASRTSMAAPPTVDLVVP